MPVSYTHLEAHRLGLRHRTSHVWLVRRKNGVLEVLLQKRSDEKDSFPGCYDTVSYTHLFPGRLKQHQGHIHILQAGGGGLGHAGIQPVARLMDCLLYTSRCV